MTTRVGITGAAGRMGRTLVEAIGLAGDELQLAAAVEQPGSSLLGADSGELCGQGRNGVAVVGSLAEVIEDIDVLIDFTVPAATLANAALCAGRGVAMVIGTTGFAPQQQGDIEQAALSTPVCKASNFSTGVNLCFQLLDMAARVLGDDVDIEVYEAHHRHKIDAPSGTALSMGAVVANALGQFSYAVACDDVHQAGTWTVRTSWSGDEGLYPATSDDQNLEVIKAESHLTINSTSQALKIDVPVDISGKFTPLPDCGGDLAGTAIEIHILGPGNISRTESVTTNDRWGHYVLQDYSGFDALGDWTVEAVFAGDDAYESSRSELLTKAYGTTVVEAKG